MNWPRAESQRSWHPFSCYVFIIRVGRAFIILEKHLEINITKAYYELYVLYVHICTYIYAYCPSLGWREQRRGDRSVGSLSVREEDVDQSDTRRRGTERCPSARGQWQEVVPGADWGRILGSVREESLRTAGFEYRGLGRK